jgi:hypothetical protein
VLTIQKTHDYELATPQCFEGFYRSNGINH